MGLVLFYATLGTITVLCFLAGLARARYRLAPVVATAVIIGAYTILVASVWTWASRCFHCSTGEDEDRAFTLYLAVAFPGLFAIIDVFLIWAAGWVSTLIWAAQPPVDGRNLALGLATLLIAIFLLMISVPY